MKPKQFNRELEELSKAYAERSKESNIDELSFSEYVHLYYNRNLIKNG